MKYIKLIIALILCTTSLSITAQKYAGGDISLLSKYEANGAIYYDNSGNAISDVLTYFKEQGWNAMRVRLFVDPNNASSTEKGQGVCQDLDYVIALGKKIKAKGLNFMLDFHYSDTWADPSKQWIPASWKSYTETKLDSAIYAYTKDALTKLVAADATPDFIQTCNEISYGMLWGSSSDSESTLKKCYTSSSSNWSYFTTLLKKASTACREICPKAKIIIHTERIPNTSVLTGIYDKMKTYGVDYDIIGLSYYPYFHGALTQVTAALTALEAKDYGKDIMFVEFGYPAQWKVNGTTYDYTGTYPYSENGQKTITDDLITILNKHSEVTGLFWWWPEANEYGLKWGTNNVTSDWYNATLFDSNTGKAFSAVSSLKNFISNPTGISSVKTEQKNDIDKWYNINGQELAKEPYIHGLFIHDGKKIMK